jgi:hypothetical protein
MGPYWKRLMACERRLVAYRRIIADLVRQNRVLTQQLAQQRST